MAADPERADDVEQLARCIVEKDASSDAQEIARRIADAQLELVRVRQVRHNLIASNQQNPNYASPKTHGWRCELSGRILTGDVANMRDALRVLDILNAKFEGPKKLVKIMSDFAKALSALDRYERRALSRRKFAIRDLDLLQRDEEAPQADGHVEPARLASRFV